MSWYITISLKREHLTMLGHAHLRSSADVYPSPIRNRPVASQRRQNVFRQSVVVPSPTPAVLAVRAGNAVSEQQLLPFRHRLYLAGTPARLPLRAGKCPPGSIRHAVVIEPQVLLVTCPPKALVPTSSPTALSRRPDLGSRCRISNPNALGCRI